MSCVKPHVFAVVVTYMPQVSPLADLLAALAPQVAQVIVVDNTPEDHRCVASTISTLTASNIRLIRLNYNAGIAKALNVGIQAAIELHATHVLLSDQDSLPTPDMVSGLLAALGELQQEHSVAAVGPSFVDQVSKQPYRFQVMRPGRYLYSNQEATESVPHVRALSLITSGTLIPIEVIGIVGMMREDFFIDHVDVEWCHRASHKGLLLFGTRYAVMTHRMGDALLRAWVVRWRNYSEYSPQRLYYRFRNFICLLRLGFVPAAWKLRASLFWLQEAYVHLFFSHQRLASLRMILRGCWDGIRGRLGSYSDNRH